jgi:predicted dehydrogenase
MKSVTRRDFVKSSLAGGMMLGLPSLMLGRSARGAGPNSEIRLGVVGLGGINTVGGVGGRGRQLIERFRQVPGLKIVALCDVDETILDDSVARFKSRGEEVATYRDLRKVFDAKDIDAVAIAIPNHWHALATVWACQAGKDVYIEKPLAYNIWEGRQMIAAAAKYNRIVQVGTQRRSSPGIKQAVEYLRSGELGAIRCGHALIYRGRNGIGKSTEPVAVPPTIDFDLWCGPVPKVVPVRKQLHYDWHWFWSTGNGEIGNNGPHHLDIARWALGQEKAATRAICIGGRFAFEDDGETANTQIAFFDYKPAPLICEIRNVQASKDRDAIGKFRGVRGGAIISCEGGYLVADSLGGTVYDKDGKKVKEMLVGKKPQEQEVLHVTNFAEAVRSRDTASLHAPAAVGHASVACCHMANLSYRLGKPTAPEAIAKAVQDKSDLADAFDRCREYLKTNGVDLGATPAVLGPWLTFDPDQDRFTGDFAEQANGLSQRVYRTPFEVPKLA